MAGNAKLTSSSPEVGFAANYPNEPRGNYSVPSLGRSGSFREGNESRLFSSGADMSRVSGTMNGKLPPLSQCLMLETITMSDHKYTRSGELRRILGISVGSASEENCFGAPLSRPSRLMAMEELKRYKESIIDSNSKARGRVKKLDEHLHRLNKYFDAVNSKKQQRNELSINERSGGLNVKMGTQIHLNPPDLMTQRFEDRDKNTVPNRRVRTSMAETRAEFRSNGLARQPLVMAKDCDMLTDGSPGSDLVEDKIRRLSAGGEGWDKKMKRKRSVGTGFTRPADIDGDLKRPLHPKISSESGLQPSDTNGFRSGSTNGTYKLDSSSSPASCLTRATSKHEHEKASLTKDLAAGLNKEKLLAKGNNKLMIREDNHIVSPSPVTKGKASRASRSGPVTAANSSPNIPHVAEGWEMLPTVSKVPSIGGGNSRKRAMASGSSSSPPMAQWVGQRPQKISRTRRANLVSPVSNLEEMQISLEASSPSDFAARINSRGMNGSLLLRGISNSTQQLKSKRKSVSTPDASFSENEEAGNKLKERVTGIVEVEEKAVNAVLNAGPSVFLTKNEKPHIKEESSDGVQRQGRSGRGSPFAGISPMREKLENNKVATKPLRSTRPGSDKSGSKAGRPLKKGLDRKGFSHRGHMQNSGSPDVTGESDDDHEELLEAANLARRASYNACSSLFWRKMEPIFSSVSSSDTSYFSQQVKFAEELHENLSQINCCSANVLGDLHQDIPASKKVVAGEIGRSLQNHIESKDSASMVKFADQSPGFDVVCENLESERRLRKVTPLYQRVLSALIVDDEIEELEENGMARNESLQCCTNVAQYNAEPTERDAVQFEHESPVGTQTWKQCAGNRFFSCNGSTTSGRSPVIQNPPEHNNGLLEGKNGYLYSNFGVFDGLSGNDLDGSQIVRTNSFNIPSSDSQYEKMCMEDKLMLELQSVGIYVDTVPDLDDGEDDVLNQDIVQLKAGLHQQIGRKKECLDGLYKAIQPGKEAEERELEQVAMDKLVELAYKKLLATRGSIASKYRLSKVSKQVALAFAKRTLARCRMFEVSGTSCFNEPALRDALFAAPPCGNDAEPSTCEALGTGSFHNNSLDPFESLTLQSDHAFAKNGPISNRGKKKEVLLDHVSGTAPSRPMSALGSAVLGGAKGKRSERDRDKDLLSRNTVAKAGRPSSSNCKGERKSKAKPKQKTAQLSTSGNGFVSKYNETTHPVYPSAAGSGDLVTNGSVNKRELGFMSPGTIPQDLPKETKTMDFTNLQLPDMDSIDDLDVGTDLEGGQDLCSWLNFDEDGLQDHDSEGLAIPMDDLTELGNMF
ncbi:uncharacterized protein LOC131318578 isoform X2 [Rhododendron vialii]|uniref:uncharacterized protein LOC131318578 isoform X2 n=1 Tax=Rhododendron vialii TaxID=182163 RepID=UPI00265E552D|nr:uncharacterized protein LOC131318578 isoform X2 [Rhododendron vialii]